MVNFFYLDKNTDKCAQYYCNKHVNKILIEITQLLCQVVRNYENIDPPYKKCKAIHPNLAPYRWIENSISNFDWLLKLGFSLGNEYTHRYNKKHKSVLVLEWIKENYPKYLPKKRKTKMIFTENMKVYQNFFNDIDAARYFYVDFKCKGDKWTNRNKPEWFDIYQKKSNQEKEILINQIKDNVYIKLPTKYKNINEIKVKRFHSFLRISYDMMFNGDWNEKIKGMTNMFNKNDPLLYQLGFGHLLFVKSISNKLLDSENLIKLNEKSLEFRNKKK